MGRFDHKVAIVTGAAGQIGAACAQGFAREGARVVGIDRVQPSLPSGAVAVTADLSVPAELENAFATAQRECGPADVLVQSAAVHARTPFLQLTAENIDHVLGINVRALLLGARFVASSMVQRGAEGGVIVNLTSVSGIVSDAESISYEASKGAVTMATRGMAVALARHGIRVVAVGPGSMAKFQELPARDPLDLDDYERQRIPLRRLGTASDIEQAVLFVASEQAAYITGTVLYVDGGGLAAW